MELVARALGTPTADEFGQPWVGMPDEFAADSAASGADTLAVLRGPHAARPLRRANTEAVVRGGGRSRASSGAPGSPGGSGRGSLPPAPLSRSASNPGSARLSHSRSNSGAGLDALRGQRSATTPTTPGCCSPPARPTAASIV